MKKLLLFLFFGATIFFTAQAGYVIRGINVSFSLNNLKNYTLTIDGEGNPLAAASLHTNLGINMGKNTITIIPADQNPQLVPCFPVFPNLEEDFDIEVRDFHYVSGNDIYVLCGARITSSYSHAFVAVIDLNVFPVPSMNYMEYPEAEIFYSICVPNNSTEYFVCGKGNNHGVIVSINRNNLLLNNCYVTDTEWEYHKIIVKYTTPNTFFLITSGRTPQCTRIGFTTFEPSFINRYGYYWVQRTEPESQCVVCNHFTESNQIILASSYQSVVTLNPVILSYLIPLQISAFHYSIFTTSSDKYYVQDIGMQYNNDVFNPYVSVAGYTTDIDSPLNHQAWYGTTGLTLLAPMQNKNYSHQDDGLYEHYKIRYDQLNKLYTGGYFEDETRMCALFGTPRINTEKCDIDYHSEYPVTDIVTFFQFGLTEQFFLADDFITFYNQPLPMDAYDICDPFKSVETPELAPTIEDETEIITYYDRITVKDTPNNTNYQIYNIMGQLIQAGTTNPDISTAQLNKGIYILRLENGKAFKFVK